MESTQQNWKNDAIQIIELMKKNKDSWKKKSQEKR